MLTFFYSVLYINLKPVIKQSTLLLSDVNCVYCEQCIPIVDTRQKLVVLWKISELQLITLK